MTRSACYLSEIGACRHSLRSRMRKWSAR